MPLSPKSGTPAPSTILDSGLRVLTIPVSTVGKVGGPAWEAIFLQSSGLLCAVGAAPGKQLGKGELGKVEGMMGDSVSLPRCPSPPLGVVANQARIVTLQPRLALRRRRWGQGLMKYTPPFPVRPSVEGAWMP